MKCRNCGEEIRRIEPGEGYDLSEYQWTHVSGGLLCDIGPPYAEPANSGLTMGGNGSGANSTTRGGGGSGSVTLSGGSSVVSVHIGGGGSGRTFSA